MNSNTARSKEHSQHYWGLAVMLGVSFLAMYILMYAMVDRLQNVYNSINQVYMAGLMAASMAVIEVMIMRRMYTDKRLNASFLLFGVVALALFWAGIRNQVGVGDIHFVRSMIPHHAGAILMCKEANLSDSELRDLCTRIIEDQQAEINQMRAILDRLSNE